MIFQCGLEPVLIHIDQISKPYWKLNSRSLIKSHQIKKTEFDCISFLVHNNLIDQQCTAV